MQIDVTKMTHAKGGVENLGILLRDLSMQTGLDVRAVKGENGNLMLQYEKEGGDAKVTTIGGDELGSSTARNLLKNAIDSPDKLDVHQTGYFLGSVGERNGNSLALDKDQINFQMKNTSGGLTQKTMGWGMTFFHELMHTSLGGGLSDNTTKRDPKGPTVSIVNKIRQELDANKLSRLATGGKYGQRLTYDARHISTRTNAGVRGKSLITGEVGFSYKSGGKTKRGHVRTKKAK
jgi:hypothetical protein